MGTIIDGLQRVVLAKSVQPGNRAFLQDLGPVRPERFSLLSYRPVWFVAGMGWGALCAYWARGLYS